MAVTNLLAQSCNKADNAIKLVRSCSQLVSNLLQQNGNKQCEDNLLTACEQTCNNLFADLLQLVRFYVCSTQLLITITSSAWMICYRYTYLTTAPPSFTNLSTYIWMKQDSNVNYRLLKTYPAVPDNVATPIVVRSTGMLLRVTIIFPQRKHFFKWFVV
jgi:hypothetical protein